MALRSRVQHSPTHPINTPPDGVDRLLLAELTDLITQHNDWAATLRHITVVNAIHPATVRDIAQLLPHATLTLWNDSCHDAVTLDTALAATQSAPPDSSQSNRIVRSTSPTLDAALTPDTTSVLMRLPKTVDTLDDFAHTIAAHASPRMRFLAAGRVKYMTTRMNDALAASFAAVTASLGRYKSRALHASMPHTPLPPARFPQQATLATIPIAAYGGVFSGTSLDVGTRFLLSTLPTALTDLQSARIVDVGCGNGLLGVWIARHHPHVAVTMTDVSAQAVRSARATVDLNNVGDRVSVRWMDALSQLPDHSADLVVCNPPFHDGTAVTTTPAHRIFADVGRVLTPGGRMLTVFNTPLAYAPTLRRLVGPTRVLATHAKFTITESVTPGRGPHSSA